MNDTLYQPVGPNNSFALVVLKSHVSQHLLQSLNCLQAIGNCVSDLFILHGAHCAPNDAEAIQLSRLGVRTHVREIDIGQLCETLNVLFSAAHQDLFVLLQAGDLLPEEFFKVMPSLVATNSLGGVFYPSAKEVDASGIVKRTFASLSSDQIKPNSNFQWPCAFSGLTLRKSHLIAMGGFHTGCQTVADIDFWLRTYLTLPHALVHVPELQVTVQQPDASWLMKFGARRLLEWSTLVRQFAGSCSVNQFNEYAEQLQVVAQLRPDLSSSLHEHLCDMANRLLFMINPVERNALQPWLQNSYMVPSLRQEVQAIDEVLSSNWGKGTERLPNLYDGGFSIYSVGSFCHAAQVLKDLALRRHTGPFDWIFSNAASATHMFTDQFKTFLDPNYFHEVAEADKVDHSSNVCDHMFYKEHFGVKFMFNHHKPFEKKDGDFFRDAVHALESDLDGEQPCVLFHIARMNGKPENFIELWQSIKNRRAPKVLMVVRFVTVNEEAYISTPVQLIRHLNHEVLEFHLPVVSKTNGVHFSDPRDNRRLKRLVYSYTQIALEEMRRQA